MTSVFMIKDLHTNTFFRRKAGPPGEGWYGEDLTKARTYGSEAAALGVIAQAGHHVTYPGNRWLVVVEFKVM